MSKPFPKTLPPKGRGRVDDTHQIALLTDFEIAALNTLKNRDKERGFPSGSGPEIRALAAQNSRPYEFVNYRGEQIPSLNDYSGAGIDGGSGERNESSGESEAREQSFTGGDYGGDNDYASRMEKERVRKAQEKQLKEEKEKDKKWEGDFDYYIGGKGDWTWESTKGWFKERYKAWREGLGPKPEIKDSKLDTDPNPDPIPKTSGVTPEELPKYKDIKGNEFGSQEEADESSGQIRTDAKTELKSEAQEFGFDNLESDYKSAYEQQLADAYDAAYEGVGADILGRGGGTGTEYDELEAAKEGQLSYLENLATEYQQNANTAYQDWLTENTNNIDKLNTLDEINDYAWTDMPEFDTDLSGGVNPETGEWDPDFMPEFYGDFTKVYDKDYKPPGGWDYDAEGNPIPGSKVNPGVTPGEVKNPADYSLEDMLAANPEWKDKTRGNEDGIELDEGSGVPPAPGAKAPAKKFSGGPGATTNTRSSARYY